MNEINEIISKQKSLNIQHTVSYQQLLDYKDGAYIEHLVKSSLREQIADYITKNALPLTSEDTHNGRQYRQTTYFFTRTELLQLANELYLAGIRRQSMPSNFNSSQ